MRQTKLTKMPENHKEINLDEPISSLLHAMEVIVELSENSNLSDEFFIKAEKHINYVSEILHLTAIQTVFFSIFIDKSSERRIYISSFAEHFNCKTIKIVRHMNEVDELVKRKLIICARPKRDSQTYRVSRQVLEAIKENRNYIPPKLENLTTESFFVAIDDLFSQQADDELSYFRLVEEMILLFDQNKHLEFVRKIKNYKLDDYNLALLISFCHYLVNDDREVVWIHDLEDLFPDKQIFRLNKQILISGELREYKLIENLNHDGIADIYCYQLTRNAKKELFSEIRYILRNSNSTKGILFSKNIAIKTMHYNMPEEQQISQLTDLLQNEKFKEIQSRLKTSGMRQGFACLFYGAPGTGKTETALQLARKTGRNILQVNVSEIKSMWVGESEKNIKELFENYRSLVEEAEIAPILLFNEADAVLGIRQEGAQRAVDKMENSIQNIILEEMEKLNGIMIATTNLTQNLDKAFERRFLYKIKFEKPNTKAKIAIWQSMIPALSESIALELSETFDLSGGQIENVARKNTVDNILSGEELNVENLMEYCRVENISKDNNRRKIGY